MYSRIVVGVDGELPLELLVGDGAGRRRLRRPHIVRRRVVVRGRWWHVHGAGGHMGDRRRWDA